MPQIKSTCISEKRGQKHEVDSINLIKDMGVEGDFHAKGGERQVSLLAEESIEQMRRKFVETRHAASSLIPGAFGENIVTEGIKLIDLKIGQKIKIGDAILEISKIGKECPAPCEIHRITGDCIMPREGIFGKVIQGGKIKAGDEIII